ncbi:hypothetical protein SCLCIDRAFT_32835 [Scleroderma citrinum Foug A]|uniref:Uncharacterized protein n=1 Tax=Scleroderma citrinum Foug A TaxID=1036808 RepID=A0A0C2YR57_9AGAM|nr:hypothetical protein SCLCIDRAFT_32835 [Scleroderma citrinum Foug A]
MEPATLLVHYSAIATDHGYALLEGQPLSQFPSTVWYIPSLPAPPVPFVLGLKSLIWSSLCLLSMLPMVPSSQTPARSIFPYHSSRFPGCDSSSIHILLVSLQMISMNVTVLISHL